MYEDNDQKEDNKAITTIFWPNDFKINDTHEKYIVLGYRVNQFKLVIIDIITKDDYKDLNGRIDRHILKKFEVVSCINFRSKKWKNTIEYDFKQNIPNLSSDQILVYFKPPKSWKLEYYSLDPITVNIFWNDNDYSKDIIFQKPSTDKYSIKMNYHWIEHADNQDRNDMMEVLRIINLTNYLRSNIRPIEKISLFASSFNELASNFDTLIIIVSFLYSILIQKTCYLINKILTYPLLKLKYKISYNNDINMRYPICFSGVLISYTIHQINFRVKQFYNLPVQFKKLKFSKIESESLIIKGTKFSPSEYIKFYNTIWLIINDLLMGIIFANILKTNRLFIINIFQFIIPKYETLLNDTITWLMNSPAGFKLNNELASFLGQLIFWVLEFWKNTTLKWVYWNFNDLLIIVETLTRFGGLSLFVSIILDLKNIIFLDVFGFYVACTRLYSWQLNVMKSLFRLFYGKKYNVLRDRVDSNDYEFDQLMLGTILFTILIYLLPTVFIFYATFILTRLIILLISVILEFVLISLNHLPVVVLLLKFKNQERLPSGILLDFQNGYFILKSKSLTLREIYKSHINSMLNFNLFNLNNQDMQYYFGDYDSNGNNNSDNDYYNRDCTLNHKKYHISDVVDDWNKLSLLSLAKKIVFGKIIKDCDYKRMF